MKKYPIISNEPSKEINSPNKNVRMKLVEQGRPADLDILVHDKDSDVRFAASWGYVYPS